MVSNEESDGVVEGLARHYKAVFTLRTTSDDTRRCRPVSYDVVRSVNTA